MAKIEMGSEEIVNLFHEVKDETTIPQWVEFEVLCNNKQKELYKIIKLNDVVEMLTDGMNFAVIFNEEVMDKLPEEMQRIAISECLAGVNVGDNDIPTLSKPNFNTYRGVLEKYGHELIVSLHESIKSLFDEKKQQEDELKAATKGKRGRKPKQ